MKFYSYCCQSLAAIREGPAGFRRVRKSDHPIGAIIGILTENFSLLNRQLNISILPG
jgi:hypothetical protein